MENEIYDEIVINPKDIRLQHGNIIRCFYENGKDYEIGFFEYTFGLKTWKNVKRNIKTNEKYYNYGIIIAGIFCTILSIFSLFFSFINNFINLIFSISLFIIAIINKNNYDNEYDTTVSITKNREYYIYNNFEAKYGRCNMETWRLNIKGIFIQDVNIYNGECFIKGYNLTITSLNDTDNQESFKVIKVEKSVKYYRMNKELLFLSIKSIYVKTDKKLIKKKL